MRQKVHRNAGFFAPQCGQAFAVDETSFPQARQVVNSFFIASSVFMFDNLFIFPDNKNLTLHGADALMPLLELFFVHICWVFAIVCHRKK